MPSAPAKELSNLIDTHVGARVRARRKALGLSQSELGTALGLTFQQVQKYERGTNRISASKLYETALALKVPVVHFFDGYDDGLVDFNESSSEQSVKDFLSTSEGVELAEAFPRIKNAKYRRKVADLIKGLAEEV